MAKRDLPREVTRRSLDYSELIATLDIVDGEEVVVTLIPRDSDRDGTPGFASMVGVLRHQTPARYEGHEFSLGSPYPDRFPQHLAGAVIYLSKGRFQSATISTDDGNDHFAIAALTHSLDR